MSAYRGQYEKELRPFIDSMRYKLGRNSHKGRWENLDLTKTLALLRAEVEELEEAIRLGNTMEIMLESADVAVFAMIASNIAVRLINDGASSTFSSHGEAAPVRSADIVAIDAPPRAEAAS